MSPLQLSVYWRLSLLYSFTPFLFFMDIFTAAITADTCRHDNATHAPASWGGSNQSEQGEILEMESDWWSQDSVCSWTDWLSYGQTVYMIGMLLGSLVGGALADRYGKRRMLLVAGFIQAFCGVVPAIFPQPHLFLATRCLTAISFYFINICAFSLAVEWTLPAARLWPPAFLSFCFSLGTMGGAPLAWLSPTWTQLHLTLALPQLMCLPLYFSIPESPRWLLLQKNVDVLQRYHGNSPADKQHLTLLLDSVQSDLEKAADAQTQISGSRCPAHTGKAHLRSILLKLVIMSFLSAAVALTYYGICLNIGSFGVSVYAAQFFSGLSEVPGLLVPLARLGRRLLTMLALFLSGSACCLSLLLSRYNGEPVLVMSLALLGKLCILAASFILLLYSIELFPTVVRQRCISLVNLSYRRGCLATTFVPSGPNGAISLVAMVVYSSGPIVGCSLCLLLPETSGVPLPDSLEDCDMSHPASMDALLRPKRLQSSQMKTETLSSEKAGTQTSN
nr:solute carrier family 22 member 6 isoform X1 [Nothobranchius furzeri]